MRIKTLLPIFLLIGGTALLNNCVPKHDGCEETNTYQEYSISQNTLDQIPYRKDGLDTLVYISTDGDTAVLYGKGVKKSYAQNRVDENSNPDCNNYTNYKTQTVDYRYEGDQLAFNRLVFYVYNYVFSVYDVYEVANYTGRVPYTVEFMEVTSGIRDYDIISMNSEQGYDDSIIVNSMPFYGKKMYSKMDETVVLYNKNYGAIKVEIGSKIWIKKF